jgi:hypothetical protein
MLQWLYVLPLLPKAACTSCSPACSSAPVEIQAFDGLGPEIINGRLAMLGFAIAAFFELAQGKDVFQQVKAYPLLTVATFTLFTIASWIPFMQGQSYNVKSGPFTPKVMVAEMLHHVFLFENACYNVS